MMRNIVMTLYALLVVCMGLITVIEKLYGTTYTVENCYGSWWFVILWALLAGCGLVYMIRQKLHRRFAVMLLHLSFLVILVGALLTYLTAEKGTVSLRVGESVSTFQKGDGNTAHFPFSLTLKDFKVINYPGTDAPLDYQSRVAVNDEAGGTMLAISMNNIGEAAGYRLFQSGYDSDGKGITLGVYHDPWGIGVTYLGYLLLFLGMVWTMFSRHTHIRALYRKAIGKAGIYSLLIITFAPLERASAQSLPVVDENIAHRIGEINVLYNDRICPINTVATDFLTKLSGKSSWEGYSADEVFVSWMIYYSPWEHQKLIRIKSSEVQHLLGIDSSWASFADFIDTYNEYKLKSVVEQARQGKYDGDARALLEADEKYNVVMMFYMGKMLRMFPYKLKDGVRWYEPGSHSMPKEIPVREQFFIKQSMDFLTESIVTGQSARAKEIIAKIKLFQREMVGDVLPSSYATKAEIFYNHLAAQRWVVFLFLTLSLLLCIMQNFRSRAFNLQFSILPLIFLAYLTLLLALRWWIGGHVPLSNGYETMLFMAWAMLIITLVLGRKFRILLGFGNLVASLCFLVAMLASGTPQITQMMPVLQSPLLSIHVVVVMCAYSLFALQALLGIQTLWLIHRREHQRVAQATALSQLLLYPAVFLLTIGIFIGAVWANVSWGTYWQWDPKETWALITMMVYAVPLHRASLGVFRSPRFYHLYVILAFLSVLVTYFGVNYLLGGMHSYA
ncbi:MAG: cytochrome c biogenesis protein CcsA [Prevotella sp.]|nr:cytochrome c biogenesis protein CcsA [Prevotella sp.]